MQMYFTVCSVFQMRELNHENLNPFVGACSDPPLICVLTLYCPKGSLQVKHCPGGHQCRFTCSRVYIVTMYPRIVLDDTVNALN